MVGESDVETRRHRSVPIKSSDYEGDFRKRLIPQVSSTGSTRDSVVDEIQELSRMLKDFKKFRI